MKCDTNNELIKSVKGNNRRPAQMNNGSIMCDQIIKKIIHYELEHRIGQECYNLLVYNNVTEYSHPTRAEKKEWTFIIFCLNYDPGLTGDLLIG